MPLIHVSWKIKTDTKPLRQQIARFLRKQLDSLFCGESLGRFFFLLFGFLDRIAHVAGVLTIEGMLGGHQQGAILLSEGPQHFSPGHGLKRSEVTIHQNKQGRYRGDASESLKKSTLGIQSGVVKESFRKRVKHPLRVAD